MFLFLIGYFLRVKAKGPWYNNYKDTDLNQAIAMSKVSLFSDSIVSAHQELVTLSNEHQYSTH